MGRRLASAATSDRELSRLCHLINYCKSSTEILMPPTWKQKSSVINLHVGLQVEDFSRIEDIVRIKGFFDPPHQTDGFFV